MYTRLLFLAVLSTIGFADGLQPLQIKFAAGSGLQISSPAIPSQPWTVAGEEGALFGRQNGKFEAWLWPVKILSNFSIRAELADYPVPIDVNALAAQIRVTPAETIITYSHAAFTIRQHMFAARGSANPLTGAAAVFEIDSARPLNLTFSFTPEMLRMWPAPNFGRPNGEWVTEGGAGAYILHTDDPQFSAIVAMPHTKPGILVPYQEHPQTFPLELKLSFDPGRDRGQMFPLMMAVQAGEHPLAQAAQINKAISDLYKQTQDYYANFFKRRLTIETPDIRLNESLQWAEIALDQMQVKSHGEIGMVAGYYESADSARPGYAWFFGRDTLWTTYAINSYGDFALTRRALDFLIKRQRDDGKMMHEYSQSADALDWSKTPYFYASADAAPLFVMAMWDYVKTSGDLDYLKTNWQAVEKAYRFTRAHEASNGIFENSQGTGWVESWPQGMPFQESYLAAVDAQCTKAMSRLAALTGDTSLASSAREKAGKIESTLESQFYSPENHFYAFSRNQNGSLDNTASIFPSVAWWDGTLALKQAEPMLSRWASSEFSTDWGTRDISNRTSFYDPISYHQGSIWPLFTGWVSLAEYRAGRSLSGYAHLTQNANLTWAQDLGSVTELLSGDYYQPLGRSSSHQMWSSAMVISPMLRGLFGLDCDATNKILFVNPQLPGNWTEAKLKNVPLGNSLVTLAMKRQGAELIVTATTDRPEVLCLQANRSDIAPCKASASASRTLRIPLPPVELALSENLPDPGSRTSQLKVVGQQIDTKQARFEFEVLGAQTVAIRVRLNRPSVTLEGGEIRDGKLYLQTSNGETYQRVSVTFRW